MTEHIPYRVVDMDIWDSLESKLNKLYEQGWEPISVLLEGREYRIVCRNRYGYGS
jgi:hypothetical protein